MARKEFPRTNVIRYPIEGRVNRMSVETDLVSMTDRAEGLNDNAMKAIEATVVRIKAARERGAARILFYGAHAIKNGLGPILIYLIEKGWITHLATNGAGIIHDWELATNGETSEHVAANVALGKFGMWTETVDPLNMAIASGATQGLGYGEAVGKALLLRRFQIKNPETLHHEAMRAMDSSQPKSAGLLSILQAHLESLGLTDGYRWAHAVPHLERNCVQGIAFKLGVPSTAHIMIGHDIIYVSPMCCGALIGEAAERDFLSFANSVSNLDGGIYISVGSAVASPMCFEKSVSMTNNMRIQEGKGPLQDHMMVIVDLDVSHWDWTQGEPPEDNPDYYLRYNKSFSRMGGKMVYAQANNVPFLLALAQALQ